MIGLWLGCRLVACDPLPSIMTGTGYKKKTQIRRCNPADRQVSTIQRGATCFRI